jgi:hypothetical protein
MPMTVAEMKETIIAARGGDVDAIAFVRGFITGFAAHATPKEICRLANEIVDIRIELTGKQND